MGTKPKHPHPLEAAVANAVVTTVVSLALRKGWTAADLKRMLFEFGENAIPTKENEEDFDKAIFEADHGTINTLLKGARPINDFHMWGFYLMLMYGPYDVEHELKDQIVVSRLHTQNRLLKAFSKFLNEAELLDPKSWAQYRGRYELFRASHLRPKTEILVWELKIGLLEDDLACTLSAKFTDRMNRVRESYYYGEIIPCAGQLMAVLKSDARKSDKIILHFDAVDFFDDGESTGCDLRGIMLSAVGAEKSSAWPFYARPASPQKATEMRTIPVSQVPELEEDILDTLNRGAVHWEVKNYPNTYMTGECRALKR